MRPRARPARTGTRNPSPLPSAANPGPTTDSLRGRRGIGSLVRRRVLLRLLVLAQHRLQQPARALAATAARPVADEGLPVALDLLVDPGRELTLLVLDGS